MLTGVVQPKGKKMIGGKRKLCKEEPERLWSWENSIGKTKWRRKKRKAATVGMTEKGNT